MPGCRQAPQPAFLDTAVTFIDFNSTVKIENFPTQNTKRNQKNEDPLFGLPKGLWIFMFPKNDIE